MKKIGMRTIKTGIGVSLCAYIGSFIIENPLNPAVACIMSMQDTVKGSFKTGLCRILGTILGGIIGFIFASILPGNPIFCGLGVILSIYICNILRMNRGIAMCSLTFLSIYLGRIDTTPFLYSSHRVLDTTIGVIIGIFINFTVARPDYLKMMREDVRKLLVNVDEYLKFKILDDNTEFVLEDFNDMILELENSFTKIIEEISYGRDNIDINDLRCLLHLCREVNFHIQIIEVLEKKLYLNKENYDFLSNKYKNKELKYELNENKSPVFNYHLMKIIELSDEIKIKTKDYIDIPMEYISA